MILHGDVLSSRNNPTVKWASDLLTKKGRAEKGAFLAEGEKLTYEAISASLPITHVFVSEGRSEEILPILSEKLSSPIYSQCRVFVVKDFVFEKISSEIAPQGVISVIKHLDFFRHLDIIYKEEFLKYPEERTLFLSSLRDPGNLGSVIRSAVAFGVEHIILSSDCTDVYNPKCVRGSMASLFRVRISSVRDTEGTVREARAAGRRVLAAELTQDAISLSEIGLSKTDVVIIGNEGHGIPESLSRCCDNSVYIPISQRTESLNASVAAGIFMWEQSKL